MSRLVFVMAMMVATAAGAAEDWRALSGSEIADLLREREVTYADATQFFHASGKTRYTTSRDAWGYWEVRGDRYCSQWPPADQWACYDVTSDDAGGVRFVGASGAVFEGRLAAR